MIKKACKLNINQEIDYDNLSDAYHITLPESKFVVVMSNHSGSIRYYLALKDSFDNHLTNPKDPVSLFTIIDCAKYSHLSSDVYKEIHFAELYKLATGMGTDLARALSPLNILDDVGLMTDMYYRPTKTRMIEPFDVYFNLMLEDEYLSIPIVLVKSKKFKGDLERRHYRLTEDKDGLLLKNYRKLRGYLDTQILINFINRFYQENKSLVEALPEDQ